MDLNTMKSTLFSELRRWRTYHKYFRRTGFYQFILVNSLKVLLFLAVLIGISLIFQKYIIDYRPLVESWLQSLRWGAVFLVFLISESFLGLIPPDFFIIWAKQFIYPYLAISILALLSFSGGIISYFIGLRLSRNEYVRNYLVRKYARLFRLLKSWGGIFIIVAALFPIPYSIVCIMVGIVKFPKRRFLMFGSTRILRFFIYALVLFAVFK